MHISHVGVPGRRIDLATRYRHRRDFAVAFDDGHDGRRQDQALQNRSTRCDAEASQAGCSWSMRNNSPAVKVPSLSTELPTSSSEPILDSPSTDITGKIDFSGTQLSVQKIGAVGSDNDLSVFARLEEHIHQHAGALGM